MKKFIFLTTLICLIVVISADAEARRKHAHDPISMDELDQLLDPGAYGMVDNDAEDNLNRLRDDDDELDDDDLDEIEEEGEDPKPSAATQYSTAKPTQRATAPPTERPMSHKMTQPATEPHTEAPVAPETEAPRTEAPETCKSIRPHKYSCHGLEEVCLSSPLSGEMKVSCFELTKKCFASCNLRFMLCNKMAAAGKSTTGMCYQTFISCIL